MATKRTFSASIMGWVTVLSLMPLVCPCSLRAENSSANYTFLVGSGFLCDTGDSSNCPAVAKSANGDSYEISGAGIFDPYNKSVEAAGTFNHRSSSGKVLETGVWTASDLISFHSYGIAPAALMQRGQAFGRPKRLAARSGPMPTGGLAIFRVILVTVSGTTETAVLQVNCALGDVPREGSVEGILITLDRTNSEYSEESSGRVMFLALRHEFKTPTEKLEQNQ